MFGKQEPPPTLAQNLTRIITEVSEHSIPTPSEWVNSHPGFRIFFSLIVAVIVGSYLKSIYSARTSLLRKIPGPWYAPYTGIHLQYLFSTGEIWKYVQKKHEKYGPVIRLGPRQIWVSEKDGLKDILQTTDLPKVTMYAEISRDRNSPGLFGEM